MTQTRVPEQWAIDAARHFYKVPDGEVGPTIAIRQLAQIITHHAPMHIPDTVPNKLMRQIDAKDAEIARLREALGTAYEVLDTYKSEVPYKRGREYCIAMEKIETALAK